MDTGGCGFERREDKRSTSDPKPETASSIDPADAVIAWRDKQRGELEDIIDFLVKERHLTTPQTRNLVEAVTRGLLRLAFGPRYALLREAYGPDFPAFLNDFGTERAQAGPEGADAAAERQDSQDSSER